MYNDLTRFVCAFLQFSSVEADAHTPRDHDARVSLTLALCLLLTLHCCDRLVGTYIRISLYPRRYCCHSFLVLLHITGGKSQ